MLLSLVWSCITNELLKTPIQELESCAYGRCTIELTGYKVCMRRFRESHDVTQDVTLETQLKNYPLHHILEGNVCLSPTLVKRDILPVVVQDVQDEQDVVQQTFYQRHFGRKKSIKEKVTMSLLMVLWLIIIAGDLYTWYDQVQTTKAFKSKYTRKIELYESSCSTSDLLHFGECLLLLEEVDIFKNAIHHSQRLRPLIFSAYSVLAGIVASIPGIICLVKFKPK